MGLMIDGFTKMHSEWLLGCSSDSIDIDFQDAYGELIAHGGSGKRAA